MSFKLNRSLILLAAILLFLMIPFSFAADNSTDMTSDVSLDNITENCDVLSASDESFSSSNETCEVLSVNETTDTLTASGYTDYYFDANAANDKGDGSSKNPYKYLTDARIKDNSIIHLANGVYSYSPKNAHKNVIIQGQNSDKTVIKGNGGEFTVNTKLTLSKIKFINVPIDNRGNLVASDVVFSQSTGYVRGDSYGGAIYSSGSGYTVVLTNCTFSANSADYGGAIYLVDGSLTIDKCRFVNNVANFYGGAIVSISQSSTKAKVNVKNSVFINDRAVNSAGGAIYLKTTKFNGYNLNFTSCTSKLGGAVALLKSYGELSKIYALNNSAVYDGGVVYQIYGNLTVLNSLFINNTANNGGALFIDCSYFISAKNNVFENNTAVSDAGAFYSLFNDYCKITNNTYLNNTSPKHPDIYEEPNLTLNIVDDYYEMYYNTLVNTQSIPKSYSSVSKGYVTSVKNQLSAGNCWAFAILSTLESCIAKASGVKLDLSEENMKNVASLYSRYGWAMDENNGGYDDMGFGYITSWLGPVLETDDIYDDSSSISPIMDGMMHIQNILNLKRNSYTDLASIKRAIMNYGAVYSGLYMCAAYDSNLKAYAQCYRGSSACDHAVSIVGWDDNIQVSGAPGKGAWIAKNSWGTSWGNKGYFYISYYDTRCMKIGDEEGACTFVLNDTIRYDKNYQYDIAKTDYFLNTTNKVWYKNKFTATDDEYLAAVSTYFQKNTNWELSIYVNNALKMKKSGTSKSGYYTIDLGDFIPLKAGDVFEIAFKITVSGDAGVPISESVSLNNRIYKKGISFISYDGKKWKDLYELDWEYPDHVYDSQVACIKAFTVFDIINTTTTLTIDFNETNPVNMIIKVFNQYDKPVSEGRVILNISGEIFTLKVTKGIAKFTYNCKRGLNSITAEFKTTGYSLSSDQAIINVIKYDVNMTANVTVDLNTAVVNVSISRPINETVTLHIPGRNVTGKIKNGFASIFIDDLDYGFNNMTISLFDAVYVADDIHTNYTITVKSTKIIASDLVTVYKSGTNFIIKLTDKYGEVLENMTLKCSLNNVDFTRTTDSKGEVTIPISLTTGTYTMKVSFDMYDIYLKSSNSFKITVKSSISLLNVKFALNSKCKIGFVDKLGKPLASKQVSVVLAGKTYKPTTDKNGQISIKITLKPGTYKIRITNPETGESVLKSIKVVKRITANKNLKMYYGAGSSYKVRVCNDYGIYKSGVKVTFRINGKSYTRSSDKNGYVSLKISQKPGIYTITARHNGFKVSNKVTVKSTLITKNIKVKKGKAFKFTAKLLNSKGKILKYKKVTFKFKGKTYKIKTNKKGIATLKITKKYKVGKYNIVSQYGKLKNKNKIIIKK